MPRFTVTITQTETRTYVLDADTQDAAVEQAQEWNDERSGDTPEGAVSYDYGFDSDTVCTPVSKTFHATVFYRTSTFCNTWMVDVRATDMDAALTEVRRLFKAKRPRAVRVDRIYIVPSEPV
jgi:hypothetical protein